MNTKGNTKTDTQTENLAASANQKDPQRKDNDAERFAHTDRDEGTLGVRHDTNANPALADEDQPTWQPPESIPEPRPADPIMKPTQQSNQRTDANSPT